MPMNLGAMLEDLLKAQKVRGVPAALGCAVVRPRACAAALVVGYIRSQDGTAAEMQLAAEYRSGSIPPIS